METRFRFINMLIVRLLIIPMILVSASFSDAISKDLNVSLAFLPKILESPNEGVFVDLVKAIDEVYEEGQFSIRVYPMARSITNVIRGQADLHIPMIRNTIIPEDQLPYRFSTESLGKVVFVIYSHKDSPLTAQMIKLAKGKSHFPYKLETGRGLESYFDVPIKPVSNLDSSLRKVSVMRTDALIWAQEETDHLIKTLNLKSIHRSFYIEFDDIIIIPKGKRGDDIDTLLTKAIKKLRSTGRLKKLHQKIHVSYQDWQPYE